MNFVELESPMLHAKFQDHRASGAGEEGFLKGFYHIYGHGGHPGHVTWNIYKNFDYPFPWKLHMELGFDRPSGFREDI